MFLTAGARLVLIANCRQQDEQWGFPGIQCTATSRHLTLTLRRSETHPGTDTAMMMTMIAIKIRTHIMIIIFF